MIDMKPVSLRDVVDALDMASDTMSSYLNRKTGELVSLTEDIMMMAEDDDDLDGISEWEREEVLKAREVMDSDDCIGLPGRYEIDEYHDTIYRRRIEKDWFKYRDGRLKELAADWLKANGIPFIDDTPGPSADKS